jgi:hypothetical protein
LYGKRIMPEEIKAVIGQYSDYFSSWWGYEDGTMLDLGDPRGYMWIKVDGKTVPDHETVRRMADARN